MAYIDWRDEFSVNVKQIDDQHKMLVDMINTLYDAMLANKTKDAQLQTVTRMVKYAATHFALEEKYMKQYSYGGYALHKKEHDAFAAKANDLQARMDKGGFVLTLEIVNFLREWLSHHILVVDKAYSNHFTERGLR